MPFQIIRNDITKVRADAIVNTANPEPIFAAGTDSAVYHAAGEDILLKERRIIGEMQTGEVNVTDAYGLNARYIIHTVGPVWIDGQHGELEALASCYRKSLHLAEKLGCRSIAFPLISTGVYGFPKDRALDTALSTIRTYLENSDMDVTLVVFSRKAYEISSGLMESVRQYIDDNYCREANEEEYGIGYYSDGSAREEYSAGYYPEAADEDFLESGPDLFSEPVWEDLSGETSEETPGNLLQEESSGPSQEESSRPYSEESNRPSLEESSRPSSEERRRRLWQEERRRRFWQERRQDADALDSSEPFPASTSYSDSMSSGMPAGMPANMPADKPSLGNEEEKSPLEQDVKTGQGKAQAGPEKAGKAQAGPNKAGKVQAGPEKAGKAQAGPEKAGKAQPVPGKAEKTYAEPKKTGKSLWDSVFGTPAQKESKKKTLQDVIIQAGENFQEMLLRLIDEKGMTGPQVYKSANLDKKLFSKIKTNPEYVPKKQTAAALAIALKLNMDETTDLLGRAGLALSPSNVFDLIIRYCIEHKIYDVYEVNALLFEYDQPLLGSW